MPALLIFDVATDIAISVARRRHLERQIITRETDQYIHRAEIFHTDLQIEYDDGEKIWDHLSARDTCFLRDDGSDEIDIATPSTMVQVLPLPQGHPLMLHAQQLTERTLRRAASQHKKAAAGRASP